MAKKTFIISNLVYGQLYPQLWLENQLKSLCDPSNLPKLRETYDIEYAIFTDDETLQTISRHPNFMALSQHCTVHVVKLTWPPDADRFASRYGVLVDMFHNILPVALEKDAYLSVIVADLVFAKHALPRMLKRLEDGHDAVFNVPIRGAADSINHILAGMPGAPTDMELFELAYANLHHLWVASDTDANLFSKFPYSMLWNSGTGLLAHNFGVTPIVFKALESMRGVRGVIDADVPSFFKNPFWATDWTDAPVAGVEPLSNGHYPPFLQHQFSHDYVTKWAQSSVMPVQYRNVGHPLYYPNKKTFNDSQLAEKAAGMMRELQSRLGGQSGSSQAV